MTDASIDAGTITPEILANPNQVLTNAIKDQKIVDFVKFDVSTGQTNDINGGGLANIAFLGGPGATIQKEGGKANAFAVSTTATFWIETVEYSFSVDGGKPTETLIAPAKEFGPTFKVPPTVGRSGKIPFTVYYTQLQYSQTVMLNFAPLSWPHVSVATLGEQTTFNLVLPPNWASQSQDVKGIPSTIPAGLKDTTTVADPMSDPKLFGRWGKAFNLKNAAIHTSLLPNGKVLYWGRRTDLNNPSPDQQSTDTFLLDLATLESRLTLTRPKQFGTNVEVNLFCSGHCFQPDGKLFVAGGHITDFNGVNQACVYDSDTETWTALPLMNHGRWYPTALTLSDGSIFVISGQYKNSGDTGSINNNVPQIWRNGAWASMTPEADAVFALYTQQRLDPTGEVFVAGPNTQSQWLDVHGNKDVGVWTTTGPERQAKFCDYGPSVTYDQGKVMFIGGGPPTAMTEFIDLNTPKPNTAKWDPTKTTNMQVPRRQHNATVLPDGSVLVTGGTKGPGFNDLSPGMPVHQAELWNPNTMKWSSMPAEDTDRCYHSTALLLPDGRVLSAGGGEGGGAPIHTDAQIYEPAYLFQGSRPTISKKPSSINYGDPFEVDMATSDSIKTVSWVRLGSVTHSNNMNQSLMFLDFNPKSTSTTRITVQAPGNPNVAPPGHYMLFLINQQGVPAVAPIIRIGSTSAPASTTTSAIATQPPTQSNHVESTLPALNNKIIAEQARPAVVVGLTSICPYGLSPCFSGAYDALRRIDDIAVVRPVPDQTHSLAFVYPHQDILPDIDKWRSAFENTANQAYDFRGIEVTLTGAVTKSHVAGEEQLTMAGTSTRPEVLLAPFHTSSNIKWDAAAQAPTPASDTETSAYARLSTALADHASTVAAQVTGRLHQHSANKFSVDVRDFTVLDSAGTS